MTKILGLDIGDQWTGIAISDALKMFAKPYNTVKTQELKSYLSDLLQKEAIETIVVGLPKTMKGTISKQTEKVIILKEQLEQSFKDLNWIFWDERLSSKRAQELQKAKKSVQKQTEHAVAAAFILDSYLTFLPQ